MKRFYEGLFLFDSTVAHEWPVIEAEVRRLCGRIDADLQVCVKFDDRKLAFEINGRKRGTYVLTYFEAPTASITELERDARLSELILRAMVLRREPLPEARMAELKAWPADTPLSPASSDSRRHDDRDRGDRGDRYGDRGDRGDRYGDRRPPRSEETEFSEDVVPDVDEERA